MSPAASHLASCNVSAGFKPLTTICHSALLPLHCCLPFPVHACVLHQVEATCMHARSTSVCYPVFSSTSTTRNVISVCTVLKFLHQPTGHGPTVPRSTPCHMPPVSQQVIYTSLVQPAVLVYTEGGAHGVPSTKPPDK